ncbi:hypothetical protein [Rhodococcus sp. ARC_M6]|uniref:hypothetical protein n=1 Tax=Rhodococcus sp. ARC_M6 TaxID=2928852 RepID=UPI001FB4373E|nr:hypothetical protein [Rhodococcus sp. ARC_M6]MCJ0906932.1 hypothetical protein [Rhodococcus sp. ARC_M6]
MESEAKKRNYQRIQHRFNDAFNNVIHPIVANFQQFHPQQFISQGIAQHAPQATNIFGS